MYLGTLSHHLLIIRTTREHTPDVIHSSQTFSTREHTADVSGSSQRSSPSSLTPLLPLLVELVHHALDACHACLRHQCDMTSLIEVVHDVSRYQPEVCAFMKLDTLEISITSHIYID